MYALFNKCKLDKLQQINTLLQFLQLAYVLLSWKLALQQALLKQERSLLLAHLLTRSRSELFSSTIGLKLIQKHRSKPLLKCMKIKGQNNECYYFG